MIYKSVLLSLSVLVLVQCSNPRYPEGKQWTVGPFIKVDSINPILTEGTGEFTCPILQRTILWDEKDVFNPAAVTMDNKVYLIFRAEDKIGRFGGTSRLGLAISEDGLHFTRQPKPVLFPDNDHMKAYEWEGGVEDPRIVHSLQGKYIMTYTAYDGTTARLCVASSPDLVNWTKHGLVLKGRYKDTWSKSGAIVCKQNNDLIYAHLVNGKYWMYFGDTDLFMATSTDLINWDPVEENGQLKSVMKPRRGYFDSRLVESGPYALHIDEGILLLYNGMNLDSGGDPDIPPGAYCAGQALFAANDPTKLIDRLEKNFLAPDKPYEIEGQVSQVCFIEGMASLHGDTFLYYGTADSRIAVAVYTRP